MTGRTLESVLEGCRGGNLRLTKIARVITKFSMETPLLWNKEVMQSFYR
jgi:hypothetical protein